MDGIIVVNKPLGITSTQALYAVRTATRQRKSGHAGTLDPSADGVLLLCLGKATKLVESLMGLPKLYRARARLDVTNACYDVERPWIDVPVEMPPLRERVAEVLGSFQGEIEQVPPAVSALKVGGLPAYLMERRGAAVELKPRPITIYWTRLLRYEWPVLEFDVACGRGTYIRALIRDIGERLRTGGGLTGLCRMAIGRFTLEMARTPEEIRALADASDCVISIDAARELIADRSAPPAGA